VSVLPSPKKLRELPTYEIEKLEILYQAAQEELRRRIRDYLEDRSISAVCRKTKIPRSSLYGVLYPTPNQKISRIISIMEQLGIQDVEN